MLRKIRITLAILSIIGVSLLFLDFTGTIHAWLGWLAKIQFLPALLALNIGVVITLVLLTLIFGRIYCSVICPLGIMQDGISWLGSKRKKNRFRYSPAMSWLRYGVLALFVVALVAGAGSLVALLAPYSSYGRIVSNLFAPLYQWGNNLLAYFAERADSCFLFGRCMDEKLLDIRYCCYYFHRTDHFVLEEWTYLLQYNLPCWNHIGIFRPLFLVEAGYRY